MTFANKGPLGQKQSNMRGTPEEKRYFWWLHSMSECCLSGRIDIELAHTSDVSDDKGMSYKGPLRHVLPISRPLHRFEEQNRPTFWPNAGFPDNTRYEWAERLYDIFEAGDDPTTLFQDMQAKANRAFLEQILRAAA